MTLPGAETMKAGIIGLDCFRLKGEPVLPILPCLVPLRCVRSMSPVTLPTVSGPLVRGGISKEREDDGLVSEGVLICGEVALEPDVEYTFVFSGVPPSDRRVELLVIARCACSWERGEEGEEEEEENE